MKYSSFLFLFLLPAFSLAQIVEKRPARYFRQMVPAGNYSGLTRLNGNRYLMVSDKGDRDGFFFLRIDIDSLTGALHEVRVDSFVSIATTGADLEGITYHAPQGTVFLSSERDHAVREYTLSGRPTGRELTIPEQLRRCRANYSFESLTYSPVTHRFWTVSESTLPADGETATATNGVRNRLRLMAFDDSLQLQACYPYLMDAPQTRKPQRVFCMGVSELLALDDGRLLVLERELSVPRRRIGARCRCRLYVVEPSRSEACFPMVQDASIASQQKELPSHLVPRSSHLGDSSNPSSASFLPKLLLCEWTTRMNLLRQNMANYEGMCLGPRLSDGRQTVILCADSQNQYAHLMRDWFTVIVL